MSIPRQFGVMGIALTVLAVALTARAWAQGGTADTP